MSKKKILIFSMLVLIIIALLIGGILILKSLSDNNPQGDVDGTPSIKVTGKLAEYVKYLSDNYYIKYSGKFKNNSGDFVETVVEYTKQGQDYALRSSDIDLHMIYTNKKLYSISNKYKMIVEMQKESFDISEYNLASDIGQVYVKTYEEVVNNTKYEVEEYMYNGKTLKYYFKEKDVKIIKYDGKEIKIIRLENNTNTELLIKPTGYTNVKA